MDGRRRLSCGFVVAVLLLQLATENSKAHYMQDKKKKLKSEIKSRKNEQLASFEERKRILYCIIPKYYSIIISTLLSVFEFILEIMRLARGGCRHTVAAAAVVLVPERVNRVL